MRNIYYYSPQFFSFSLKMRNWYQNITKYLFSISCYWFPQLLPPPVLNENEQYIQNLTDKFKNALSKNDDSFKKKLNKNIEKEIYRENVQNTSILNRWRSNLLIESTPRGNVIMYYDVDKQSFSYYSDTNSIPYSTLNAISMKYVLTFNCLDFFMDTKYEYESTLLLYWLNEEKKKIKKEGDGGKKKPLFDMSKGPFLKKKRSIINKDEKTEEQQEESKENKDKLKHVNRFICEGKYRDYSLLQKVPKVYHTNGFHTKVLDVLDSETQLQEQVMSYKDFKKLNRD